MHRGVKRLNLSALVALFLFVLASVMALSASFHSESLTIRTQAGKEHVFTAELAISADQRQQGLMNRDEMADDRGMLFDFGETRRVYMWMKNTYLPLDMLFADASGRIVVIRADTLPLSEDIIDSREPVRFVLELNAGAAARLGITAGDVIDSAYVRSVAAKP